MTNRIICFPLVLFVQTGRTVALCARTSTLGHRHQMPVLHQGLQRPVRLLPPAAPVQEGPGWRHQPGREEGSVLPVHEQHKQHVGRHVWKLSCEDNLSRCWFEGFYVNKLTCHPCQEGQRSGFALGANRWWEVSALLRGDTRLQQHGCVFSWRKGDGHSPLRCAEGFIQILQAELLFQVPRAAEVNTTRGKNRIFCCFWWIWGVVTANPSSSTTTRKNVTAKINACVNGTHADVLSQEHFKYKYTTSTLWVFYVILLRGHQFDQREPDM